MTTSAAVPTPTLDAIREVQPQSQAIGEFLDWLGEQGYVLAGRRHHRKCPRCEMWLPDMMTRGDKQVECICEARGPECFGQGECGHEEYHVEHPSELLPRRPSTDKLLHRFFGVDEAEAERERRALMASLR